MGRKHLPGKPQEQSNGMRRSFSSQDATARRQQNRGTQNSSSSQSNATWDSRGSQVLSSAAAEMLFQDDRRGSNGVIPGQQLPNFPPPALRPHTDTTQALHHEEDQFNSSLSRISKGGAGWARRNRSSRIYDDPVVVAGYNAVPLLELDRLPRGGISIETQSVGRIQVSHRGHVNNVHLSKCEGRD